MGSGRSQGPSLGPRRMMYVGYKSTLGDQLGPHLPSVCPSHTLRFVGRTYALRSPPLPESKPMTSQQPTPSHLLAFPSVSSSLHTLPQAMSIHSVALHPGMYASAESNAKLSKALALFQSSRSSLSRSGSSMVTLPAFHVSPPQPQKGTEDDEVLTMRTVSFTFFFVLSFGKVLISVGRRVGLPHECTALRLVPARRTPRPPPPSPSSLAVLRPWPQALPPIHPPVSPRHPPPKNCHNTVLPILCETGPALGSVRQPSRLHLVSHRPSSHPIYLIIRPRPACLHA